MKKKMLTVLTIIFQQYKEKDIRTLFANAISNDNVKDLNLE